MVEARLIPRILVRDKARSRLFFFLIGNKVDRGHFVENEIRERRLVFVVRGAHLNAQSNALIVLFCKIEDEGYVIRQLESARPRLNLPPGWPYVKLLPQRKADQV